VTKEIAFVKEKYPGEARTMVVPQDVPAYLAEGYDVYVEENIGAGVGFPDTAYRAAGAVVQTCDEIWTHPLVVKYKSPQPEEYDYFRPGLTLATSYHPEGEAEMIARMCEARMTGFSLEYAVTEDGIRPMPFSDMEIAGKLAFFQGAYLLQSHFGGSGVLLSHVAGLTPPKVVVIGYGNVGGAAARSAAAMGCRVTALGSDKTRLRRFAATVPPSVTCRINTQEVLTEELKDADLVIGAVLIATEDSPAMITKEHLKIMKQGSLIMDITCGYGDGKGWMPTFPRWSSVEEPAYSVDGILHFKMDRTPGRVPRTASEARSKLMVPYLLELGALQFDGVPSPLFESCRIVDGGIITNGYLQSTFETMPTMSQFLRPAAE